MALLIIPFCLITILIVFLTNKDKLFSPIKLFFCMWSMILTLSCIHISALNVPSNEAYFLILLMLISFLIGNVFCLYLIQKKTMPQKKKTRVKLFINLFLILSSLLIIFYIIDIYMVIKYRIDGYEMWEIRNWTLAPYGSSNPILDRRTVFETILRKVILEPFSLLVHPIAAYFLCFEKNKKIKTWMLVVSVLTLVTGSIAGGGGRLGYVFFVMCYGIAFWTLYRTKGIKKEIFKKYVKIIVALSVMAFVAVLGFTAIRVGKGSFFKQFYKYFALPPTLLSEWLPEIKTIPHTYGLLTTFGLHSYFFRALSQIGLSSLVPGVFKVAFDSMLAAEIVIPVGDGVGNAFVTPVYYFYIDGGYPFVIIASALFGFLVTYIYNRIIRRMNVRNYVLYMIVLYGVLVSFMRIQTVIPSYLISILLVFVLTYSGKKRRIHKKK